MHPNPSIERTSTITTNGGTFLWRAFTGRLPLWKAFWLMFVPAPFALYLTFLGTFWVLNNLEPETDYAIPVLAFASFALSL